jgi:hypothetical protein
MSEPLYMDLGNDCCNSSERAIESDDGGVIVLCNGCDSVTWMGQSYEGDLT